MHEHRRSRLVQHARRWLRSAAERRGAGRDELEAAEEALDPHALTIGFARRFATYKRAALLFSDLARVKKLLLDAEPPRAARLRGQGAPAGPRRQGAHSLHHRGEPQRRAEGAGRLHRRLRHAHRARADERSRRVVEHAAPAPRGERHERHEGGGQRRAQPERPRRLVRRGLARPRVGRGLGDRPGRGVRRRLGRRPRGRASLRPSRARGRAALLQPRGQRRAAPPVDKEDEELHLAALAPVQHGADGARVRGALLRALGGAARPARHAGDLAGARALTAWKEACAGGVAGGGRPRDHGALRAARWPVGQAVPVSASVALGTLAPSDVAVELYHGPTAGGTPSPGATSCA